MEDSYTIDFVSDGEGDVTMKASGDAEGQAMQVGAMAATFVQLVFAGNPNELAAYCARICEGMEKINEANRAQAEVEEK